MLVIVVVTVIMAVTLTVTMKMTVENFVAVIVVGSVTIGLHLYFREIRQGKERGL